MEELTIEQCNEQQCCQNCPYREGSCTNIFSVDFMGDLD